VLVVAADIETTQDLDLDEGDHGFQFLLLLQFLNDRLCDLWLEFLATDPEVWVRFSALPHFLRSSGSGTGANQPRECNLGATWKRKIAAPV
jgi:hypothetical protein